MAQTTESVNNRSLDAADFGVLADGADHSVALFNAITAARGRKLALPSGDIYVKRMFKILEYDVNLIGNNTSIYKKSTDTDVDYSLRLQNDPKLTVSILSGLVRGDRTVQVESTDNIKVGDMVRIDTDEVYAPRIGWDTDYKKGFLTKVIKITGAQYIRLKDRVPYDFDETKNLRLSVFNPVEINISGIDFKVEGDPTTEETRLLQLRGVINSSVSGGFKNATGDHLNFRDCYNAKFEGNIHGNIDNEMSYNYGITIDGCNHLNIIADIESRRHCISLSGIPSTKIKIIDSVLYSEVENSVDSHVSESFEVRNSQLMSGVKTGGGHAVFNNCYIENQDRFQGIVQVREDMCSFIKSIEFNGCEIRHNGTDNHDTLLQVTDASHLEYVTNIKFNDCDVYTEKDSLGSVIRTNYLKLGNNINIVIDRLRVHTHLEQTVYNHEPSINKLHHGVGKQNFTLTNSEFRRVDILGFSNFSFVFKRVIIQNNTAYEESRIRIVDTSESPSAMIVVKDNFLFVGEVLIHRINNTVICDNNTVQDAVSTFKIRLCLKAIVTNNKISESPYELRVEDGQDLLVGWNRRLDEGDLYHSFLPQTAIDLETVGI